MQPDARAVLAEATSEAQLQAAVLELAARLGWRCMHIYDSRRSTGTGWPDLALCRPPRLVLAELKAERGRIRPEQRAWLAALGACPGVECYCWRPRDLLRGEIERVLTLAASEPAPAVVSPEVSASRNRRQRRQDAARDGVEGTSGVGRV